MIQQVLFHVIPPGPTRTPTLAPTHEAVTRGDSFCQDYACRDCIVSSSSKGECHHSLPTDPLSQIIGNTAAKRIHRCDGYLGSSPTPYNRRIPSSEDTTRSKQCMGVFITITHRLQLAASLKPESKFQRPSTTIQPPRRPCITLCIPRGCDRVRGAAARTRIFMQLPGCQQTKQKPHL